MEKQRVKQKKRKDQFKTADIATEIPDAPTLEEFECLLSESPINYPKGEGIENIESELHSAAIDTETFEKEDTNVLTKSTEELNTTFGNVQGNISRETITLAPSAPAVEELEKLTENNFMSTSITQIDEYITKASFSSEKLHEIPAVVNSTILKKSKVDNSSLTQIEFFPGTNITAVHKVVKPFTETQLTIFYNNRELNLVEAYINDFIEYQLRNHVWKQQHKLHELLMNYLRVRNQLSLNSSELDRLKKASKEKQKELWYLEKTSLTETGECQDGNQVTATHEFSIARFNQQTLIALTRILTAIKESLHSIQALYSYEVNILRMQIDHYVQHICTSCKEVVEATANAPVSLLTDQPASNLLAQLAELRTCITILFSFQRKFLTDVKFVADSRDWLTKLVAVLLRVATWQDHLFLLSHILRCPGGVTNWARSYVQMPLKTCSIRTLSTSPLDDPYVDHIVATLSVILMPVKEREKFLEQDTDTATDDTLWVHLDEEGEEDEDITNLGVNLLESDLICLLHQIPFDKLFEQILYIEYDNNEDYLQDPNSITEHHMLRIFSFSTVIVRLLKKGLKTYNTPKYRQFAKRLSALIRDVVQYASDLWESFNKTQIDAVIHKRLQTEFDCFFLRATLCIFSSRRLGAWQYLAAIPYRIVSLSTLWTIFNILHSDSLPDDLIDVDSISGWEITSNSTTRNQFINKLSHLPGDESYFLLTTFASMAMSRDAQEYEFVRAVTIDLFEIGYLNPITQDSCSKDARSLLSNLTTKYPSLLSDIISKLKENFVSVGKLSLYLFTELSINLWIPEDEDFKTLSNWLHRYPFSSTESQLARLIISNLNWGFDHLDNLYLTMNFHRRMALLIVDIVLKSISENAPTERAALLYEGVKQVSSIVRTQSCEQIFDIWAWKTLSKLRLHQLEQSAATCQYTISSPRQAFACIPNVDSDAQLANLDVGLRDKQPIACYIALRMTLYGHSVPLICSRGFDLLQVLQNNYKYEPVILVISSIFPLFLECPESLLKNEQFMELTVGLLQADKTYMRLAKNFISSDFPGPILKTFANMIEYHLQSSRRFCLQSPEPLVKLWLNIFILIPNWNRDQSSMYLMDILIRASFFHMGSWTVTENIFRNLYSNIASNKSSGSTFGAFFNWVTGSIQSSSFLSSSVQSVWLAYLILRTEQEEREIKTGLWCELLRELSNQTKTSIEVAFKKACAIAKVQPYGVNNLSIYRWCQQALDTPMDHPLLPLLWQKFFTLFLARVPSTSGTMDKGGVGDKFFEGILNLSYLKKIKNRLLEITEYFHVKEKQESEGGKPITDERRVFYFSTAKYYKTLCLWLEEPRLKEAGLYLSVLPPQYMSQKLILILQNDETPWFEYIDYWSVQHRQLFALKEWQQFIHHNITNLTMKAPNQTPTMPVEPSDPLQRIFRRLRSYEQPVPPPSLTRFTVPIAQIPIECLYNSEAVVELIKPHLKIILDYAKTFTLMLSEHTAIDCHFLELVPTLYKVVENQVILHVLCDPAPSGQRRPRSATPPVVNCAGPAIIRITISEAQISRGVDDMISQNRAEYENLLLKASQPPSTNVIRAFVFIDDLIKLLENELNMNRTSENSSILNNVQESGIRLFYHLLEYYTEEAAYCPSTKQLITTCIEKLGQLFVSGEESQGPHLLKTIIERPGLGGLLGPHFTPVAGGATTFLQMYQIVVDISTGVNVDLCFVLLTKFDVGSWLNYRRPRLTERSTFIKLVINALCNIGLEPDDERLILHELFRNHLRLVLLYEFPEHYGEVLSAILRGSENQTLALDVWRDLLKALQSHPKNAPSLCSSKAREEIRRYATEQRLLSRQEIHDTAILLSRHFLKERLQYGLYGLYPKYRTYSEPLTIFLGMIGHALVVLTLQSDRGTLADELCDKIWHVLSEMFAPWITPYWTKHLREHTAAWIQQLTDDRSVLLPWINTDVSYANKMVSMFVECIQFILDTMPASNKILCFLWQFYVTNYANASVKDHVLNTIHENFLSLQWDRFNPTVADVELMVKVTDQYLFECHVFLGSIFISINWTQWISELTLSQYLTISSRGHVCLLNLLIKLSNEPNVRQNDRTIKLVQDAKKFSWHLVDAVAYDQFINWHVMTCDPRVILCINSDQCHPLDLEIHNLIKIVGAYDPVITHFHPTTLKKRQIYVRSSIKFLIHCTTKFKSLVSTNIKVFPNALSRMLDDMEAIIMHTVSEQQQVTEAGLLITELLYSVNQSNLLVEQLRISWSSWLQTRSACNPILLAILRVIGVALTSPSAVGEVMEAALDAYFKQNVLNEYQPSWTAVLTVLQPVYPRQPPIEGILVSEGRLLTLYAIFLKRLPSCHDIREEGMLLTNLVDWIAAIKPIDTLEEKLPLLWVKALELIYRQCQYSESTVIAVRALKGLARALLSIADDANQGWGILDAIGLRKSSHISPRCKFLSRALAVYSLTQLPESKPSCSEQNQSPHQNRIIRFTPHSPGHSPMRISNVDLPENQQHPFSSNSTMSSPNSAIEVSPTLEALRAMEGLEALLLNKNYFELRGDIEQSIRMIRDPANSLHNSLEVCSTLVAELYTQPYLHVLMT